MMFFNFLNLILCFWNFFDRVGLERTWNEIFFLLLILGLSHSVLSRIKVGMLFFSFLNFYTIFFLIFWTGLVLERNWNEIFFLILSLSHRDLAWNKVGMMFSNFLNFYTIFWKFSKPGWVGMVSEWNFFFSFSTFVVPFWLDIKPEWCFLIFWIFILFLGNFLNWVG